MTSLSQPDLSKVICAAEFESVDELFSLAEDKLKLVERLENEGLLLPSINELRYAGFHLLKAINIEDDEQRRDEIRKAQNHCERSIFDAYEVGIFGCIERINQFLFDYRNIPLGDIVPEINEIRTCVDDALDFIEDIPKDDRVSHYRQCEEQFERLYAFSRTTKAAREEANKRLEKVRRDTRNTLIATAATVVGAVAAVAALVFGSP